MLHVYLNSLDIGALARAIMQILKWMPKMSDMTGTWATVVTSDGGLSYEGIIANEAPHGVYLSIGGDPSRLILFPWVNVNRVIYKTR